jgi:hypothetical protein
LVTVFLLLGSQLLWAREWSDATGKFKIEAEFVAVKNGKVVLERADQDFLKSKREPPSDSPFETVDPKKVNSSDPTTDDGRVYVMNPSHLCVSIASCIVVALA